MLEEYIYRGSQKLRCGYTTGSCAAAAAKAAARMLLTGQLQEAVELMTPKGVLLHLEVLNGELAPDFARCAIRKDGGDDPDITSGILVYATVCPIPSGMEITGGPGIGRVTKAGLDQPVGEYAINSTPRRMIAAALSEVAEEQDYRGGLRVCLSIPEGETLARKTFNPRIGIVGGISVIGTTGIVEPMSNAALIETIRVEARMRRAEGRKFLLLTIGNYSKNFISTRLPFAMDKSVTCSNFIGEAIDIAMELGFRGVLIIGHLGKLVKLGTGIMNTHSGQADGRMDVLVTCGVLAGAEGALLRKILNCATVDAALDYFREAGLMEQVLDILAARADHYLHAKGKGDLEIGAVMFSDKHQIAVKTSLAEALIQKITEEYHG